MCLNDDLLTQILGRVDGITLAKAGSVSSQFWLCARQDTIWEVACSTLWPSTADKNTKEFISSQLGGFRNLYATCFPSIDYHHSQSSERNSRCSVSTNPSDFVCLVDVQYDNKVVYCKVLWGIPATQDFERWFCNCPFRIDLINFDEDRIDPDELPTIGLGKINKGSEFWGHLMENIRLSWIVINRKTGEAANFSSWIPLFGQKCWSSHKDSVICFASLLPAEKILPCKSVLCKIVMKCKVSESDHTKLKISELSMQFEDIMGGRVNGRNSLKILERAMHCRRTIRYKKILESCVEYMREQRKLKEEEIRKEGCVDAVFVITATITLASFLFSIF